jgi:hypothetical protein
MLGFGQATAGAQLFMLAEADAMQLVNFEPLKKKRFQSASSKVLERVLNLVEPCQQKKFSCGTSRHWQDIC